MSYPNLNLLLQAANRRRLFLGLARVGGLSSVVLILSVVVAIGLDAIFAFPGWALCILDGVLVTLIAMGLVKLARVVRAARFDARRLARLLEQQLNIRDNALINAIDLRTLPETGMSRRLADESIRRGESVARQIDVRRAIARRPASRAAWYVVCSLAAVLIARWIIPGVFARGLPRLLDPTGNHPPFTLVRFEVDVQPQPLPYGSSATISAHLTGPVAIDRADVVFADASREASLPMMETDEGFRVDLQRIEQSREFYIDTPQGRSDWYRLDVQQVPIFEEVWVTYQFPSYTGWAERRHRLVGHDIQGLAGTRVTLEATSNFPLAKADVSIHADVSTGTSVEELQLLPTAEDARRVQGQFVLTQSGRIALRLVGYNDQPSREQREAAPCRSGG